MKLLLVNFFPPETMARYTLSSYVLKAHLERHMVNTDLEVEVADFICTDQAETALSGILDRTPDVIGFSCYGWNMPLVHSVVEGIKAQVDIPCLLGGPEISAELAKELASKGIGDAFCVGEGEEWLLAAMNKILHQGGLPAQDPTAQGSHGIYARQPAVDLSRVPTAYGSGAMPSRLYRYQQAFVETQRGCRNKCAYCQYHRQLTGVSYFPLQTVLDELDHLILEERVRAIRFLDAVFTSDLDRAKGVVAHLLDLKSRKGIRLPWIYWEFTADSVDREFLDMVSRLKYKKRINNCDSVQPKDRPQLYSDLLTDYTAINGVGLQTLNALSNRATSRSEGETRHVLEFLDTARKMNIAVKLDLMLGLPHETFATFFQGLEKLLPLLKHTDHVLNIHRVQLLPGTKLKQRASKLGLVRDARTGHLILATPDFGRHELERASRLTAMLFRTVNSPLRSLFFQALEREGDLVRLLQSLLDQAVASRECATSMLAGSEPVDDVYWNDRMFTDIPSAWLEKTLAIGEKTG